MVNVTLNKISNVRMDVERLSMDNQSVDLITGGVRISVTVKDSYGSLDNYHVSVRGSKGNYSVSFTNSVDLLVYLNHVYGNTVYIDYGFYSRNKYGSDDFVASLNDDERSIVRDAMKSKNFRMASIDDAYEVQEFENFELQFFYENLYEYKTRIGGKEYLIGR